MTAADGGDAQVGAADATERHTGQAGLSDRVLGAAVNDGMRTGMVPTTPLWVTCGGSVVEFISPGGVVLGLLSGPSQARAGVVMLGGAIGGFAGPGGRAYHELAERFGELGVAALQLHPREPGEMDQCVQDVVVALSWWRRTVGVERVAAVGHSFGGALAIRVAAISREVHGVAALAPQLAGTEPVGALDGCSLLLLHGADDHVLPAECSQNIFARAQEPKSLVLLPGCGHAMTEAVDEVVSRVLSWSVSVLEE